MKNKENTEILKKRSMTSFEYNYLCNELDRLIGKRINKIYELEPDVFRIRFDKEDLIIHLGKRMNITKYIEKAPERPSNFTMFLRKRLLSGVCKKIYQHKTDRILIFEYEVKGEKYSIVFEMFAKGNLILLDKNNKIISSYHREEWKDRVIRKGNPYKFPKSAEMPLMPSKKEIEKLLNEKYVVVCLSKLPLGTIYIKEVLKRCKIDEKKKGSKINDKEKECIEGEIKKIVKEAKPHGFFENNKIMGFALTKLSGYAGVKEYVSLNELLDDYYYIPKEEIIEKEDPEKMRKLRKRLDLQKKHLEELRNKEKECKKIGDKIYENYDKLEELIKWVEKKIGKEEWDEIDKELKKINARFNKKTKEIEIDLD